MGRYATAQLMDLVADHKRDDGARRGQRDRRHRPLRRRPLRLQSYRRRSHRRILRNEPLAQSTRRARRPDIRSSGGRHRTAIRRRHFRRRHQPARPDERGRQGAPVFRNAPGAGHPADGLPCGTSRLGIRGELDYPLPWANQPARSHLVTSDELRAVVESAGFAVEHWNDLTDQAAALMQAMLAQPANPLGLHAFVTDFKRKVENLTHALADGRLRAIQAVRGNRG